MFYYVKRANCRGTAAQNVKIDNKMMGKTKRIFFINRKLKNGQ